jgi:hypothetical protein
VAHTWTGTCNRGAVSYSDVKSVERVFYIATICILSLIVVLTMRREPGSTATFKHLEIEDTGGHTRIILGTDSQGTAEIRFVDETGKKTSKIEQYRDGSTSMRFAGVGSTPSLTLDAPQAGPGPMVSLRGNTDDQMMYLGAADRQDDSPSGSAEAYGWGLYVNARGFKPPYAAIGAYRDRKNGEIRGFVHPERQTK